MRKAALASRRCAGVPNSARTWFSAFGPRRSLPGTPGQIYVERRGIPVRIADAAGVRYAADFAGRAAVVVPLYGRGQSLVSLHTRYLNVLRAQDKMLTIGPGGGVITVLEGWNADPAILSTELSGYTQECCVTYFKVPT